MSSVENLIIFSNIRIFIKKKIIDMGMQPEKSQRALCLEDSFASFNALMLTEH